MIKGLIKILVSLFVLIIIFILYLSFVGINTNQLNKHIESQVLDLNKDINLRLKKVKLLINLKDLSISAKTNEPKIFIYNNELELVSVKTSISIKSLFNKKFLIEDLEISTKAVKLRDLILLARSFKNSPQLFVLDSIVNEGYLVGDIFLNFDSNGKIKDDYEVKGFIKKGELDFFKKNSINNLNFFFKIKNKNYNLESLSASFNKIKLSAPTINIEKKENLHLVSGKIINEKENVNIDLLDDLLGSSFKDNDVEKIILSSNNDFNFNINTKYKIKNFTLKSKVNLSRLVYKNNSTTIKSYLPEYKNLIELEDHLISINYKKNQLHITGKGNLKIKDKIDKIHYKISKKKEDYFFDTNIKINENLLSINALQYEKKKDVDSLLKLKGVYKKNKDVEFEKISFIEGKNTFLIENLDLNQNLDVASIKKLSLNYINKNKIKNQIDLKKNKNSYNIVGKSFDASKLINEILSNENDDSDSSSFGNLNTNLNIKIKKMYLNKDTYINELHGDIDFKNNTINRLKLTSFFPNNKELNLTINTNEDNEKITTLFSNYPKPLVKQYKFIKGFEEGILDFYSIKKNKTSNSILKINNFKLQEVPVLAKILTLSSLQGIADILTGEGIRFSDFEMKFSNKKGLMIIEEMYAIGPAISVLMEGYIETEKLISLRGTLVPATTINKSIASIPLLGNILVGKKIGEGVFGVSFKVKGEPDDLKTTVNPIKTLTPRFITRTLEKIKKN